MTVTVRTVRFGISFPNAGQNAGKPKSKGGRGNKTKSTVIDQIREEIKKRDELRAELAKYTIDAIAERVGLHPRTVEKLLAK